MSNYWIDFWQNYAVSSLDKDEQSQVLRTSNKKPISEELWQLTLNEIESVLSIRPGEKVLDLCAGNGLIARQLASKGASVVAVDISDALLRNFNDVPNIRVIHSDVRSVDFDECCFDKVIIYAGIQYLDYREAVLLIRNIHRWLVPGGILFVGDIPDLDRLFRFFNTDDRQKIYFDNLLSGEAIVGHWYQKEWFQNLTNYVGFSEGKHLRQNEKLLNAHFRFDFLFRK